MTDIKDSIASLPSFIFEGIKDIFIPDSDYIDTAFNNFLNDLKVKFNFDTTFFTNLFTNEKPVEDIETEYNIPGLGTMNLKFLDTKYLIDGVSFFRPFIRGFLVLLMMLYHVRQLIGFFGYNAGVIPGRNEAIEQVRKGG